LYGIIAFAMFTGLIEARGTVVSRVVGEKSVRLVVEAGTVSADAALGDSIAVNGCCLTVVGREGERLAFDLLRETDERTNLKAARPGDGVNLEPALRADARLGGHFVTGHIEAAGKISVWEKRGSDYYLGIAIDPIHDRYLVPKGCIAIDGISLTVGETGPGFFSVWIIPHTREVTTLGARAIGDAVNLEFDLLAKYAAKILETFRDGARPA
jgi:riboflavin synthase